MATSKRAGPLLAAGNEEEWSRINQEEACQDAEFVSTLTVAERLELGQKLCDHAFEFMNAVRASGHGPSRDPRA